MLTRASMTRFRKCLIYLSVHANTIDKSEGVNRNPLMFIALRINLICQSPSNFLKLPNITRKKEIDVIINLYANSKCNYI